MQNYYLEKILYYILCEKVKNDLKSFIKMGFCELNQGSEYKDNWHIDEISRHLIKVYAGAIKRLIINIPPRYLKSISTSVCFVAWTLGKNPYAKIIVVSYSEKISVKHSLDTKKIMQSKWYKEIFPQTIIAKGENQKTKFCTTLGGFRLATSTGGSLTGEGGDLIILDDPQKPITINSEKQRENLVNWFFNTLLSRLNSKKKGAIIIVMQRLHYLDLCGVLMNKSKNTWYTLILKLVAEEDEKYRKKGDLLHKELDTLQDIKNLKEELGEKEFNTQYQQSPLSDVSYYFKNEYFCFIEFKKSQDDLTVISIDSASKIGLNNDFTAITIWCIKEDKVILINCKKVKLEFGSMLNFVKSLILQYNAIFTLIEDKSSGIPLIQEIKKYSLNCNIVALKVKYDKTVRFLSIIHLFENRAVLIDNSIENIDEIKKELLLFPNFKHDDIVDSISHFLNWYQWEFKNISKSEPRIRKL